MYSAEEASRIKQQFWTSFGQYMAPVLSAENQQVNWINYKTGIRYLYFRMEATSKQATISIEMLHKDPAHAATLYKIFEDTKASLEDSTGEEWEWEAAHINEHGQPLSRIFKTLAPVNIFKQTDWPAIISFFKPRLIALDCYWTDHKMIFEMSV